MISKSTYAEIYEYFSKVRAVRVLGAFFVMMFFFPYEILSVSEEFLYLISFVVFIFNLVKNTKGYIYSELENRRLQIKNLYLNLVELRKIQIKKLHSFFEYVQFQDLEISFFNSLNLFNYNLYYNFYLNLTLVEFNSDLYSTSDFDYVLLKNNMFSELEENTINYFNN